VKELEGRELNIVCEILLVFGGTISKDLAYELRERGVTVIHDPVPLIPDEQLTPKQRIKQNRRVMGKVGYAWEIIKKRLGIKQKPIADRRNESSHGISGAQVQTDIPKSVYSLKHMTIYYSIRYLSTVITKSQYLHFIRPSFLSECRNFLIRSTRQYLRFS
jgi:hypothetical protein